MFRAFKTHEAPRVNQAEVIHAGWSHRDPKGITLLEAAEFDTRDSIILKAEVEAFAEGGIAGGSGPNQQKITERNYQRIMQAAQKKGADLVDFGVSKPAIANVSNFVSSNSGCNPPKKKHSSGEILLTNRCASATSVMVIRKYKELQSLTRTYVVAASSTAHSNCDVQLSNTPSCTCRDFKKNGTRCLCKHIIFILMKVYMLGEDDTILSDRYFSDEDLKGLYINRPIGQIPPNILQKKAPKRSGKDYQGMLRDNPSFNNPQTWTLMKKEKRCAKCTGCKSIIESGNICLHVDGALVTVWGEEYAKVRSCYFCAKRSCLRKTPPWTNIKYPMVASYTIDEPRAKEIFADLNIATS